LGGAGMKSYVSGAAVALAEECVHFHGAMGMTDELEIGIGFKRLLVLAAFLGDGDEELSRFMRLSSAGDPARHTARTADPAACTADPAASFHGNSN
jgi:alkylation response protein AidB-like acyl-CoA dehydrogenase